MRDLLDLRILEHRDVEICRFFCLVIEPQHRSNSCMPHSARSEMQRKSWRSRFKWTWLLTLSPAEFPRTRRARGFSGRGPRESIDRVWQCKLREAVPARTRARCPD